MHASDVSPTFTRAFCHQVASHSAQMFRKSVITYVTLVSPRQTLPVTINRIDVFSVCYVTQTREELCTAEYRAAGL